MSREERVCLGAVVGVHGIRGEVKVKSFTEIDRDLGKYGDLENEDASRRFTVKVVGHSKDLLRVKIRGVDDRNTAETLIGTGLYISRTLLPELAEEEYYHADLIGLEARVLPEINLEKLMPFIILVPVI
ncbi:MAG: ribosome maturation factor RimM [Alphaproteobacteria bacterium]